MARMAMIGRVKSKRKWKSGNSPLWVCERSRFQSPEKVRRNDVAAAACGN